MLPAREWLNVALQSRWLGSVGIKGSQLPLAFWNFLLDTLFIEMCRCSTGVTGLVSTDIKGPLLPPVHLNSLFVLLRGKNER